MWERVLDKEEHSALRWELDSLPDDEPARAANVRLNENQNVPRWLVSGVAVGVESKGSRRQASLCPDARELANGEVGRDEVLLLVDVWNVGTRIPLANDWHPLGVL